MHDSCSFCSGYVCDGIHGDGICNRYKEERSRRPQSGQPSSVVTCQVCRGTLAEGESHDAPCGNAAHCTKDGKTHDAASCGTSGHYTCDGKTHEKAACGDHYACDGKTHDKLACDHYACDDGPHGNAACGVSGHFACDDGLHKKADCGVEGHYTCDSADHGACGTCGDPLCDGHIHKIEVAVAPVDPIDPVTPDDGPVSVPVTVTCPGCGAQVGDTADHLAPCRNDGHFTCAADYVAEPHASYADCNDHHLCDSRDHSRCACSLPRCSGKYVAEEHGMLACGEHCEYNIPDDIEGTHNQTPCLYV